VPQVICARSPEKVGKAQKASFAEKGFCWDIVLFQVGHDVPTSEIGLGQFFSGKSGHWSHHKRLCNSYTCDRVHDVCSEANVVIYVKFWNQNHWHSSKVTERLDKENKMAKFQGIRQEHAILATANETPDGQVVETTLANLAVQVATKTSTKVGNKKMRDQL